MKYKKFIGVLIVILLGNVGMLYLDGALGISLDGISIWRRILHLAGYQLLGVILGWLLLGSFSDFISREEPTEID